MLNLALAFDAIAAAAPDRRAQWWHGETWSFAETAQRAGRFGAWLNERSLGVHTPRSALAGHECGQDTVALFLRNQPAYLEAMLGAYKARCAPFNVNYRYTVSELAYVLVDADARVVVCDDDLAELVMSALAMTGRTERTAILPVSVYQSVVATGSSVPLTIPDAEDLYILYTGGTTGKPKGVLWRQGDFARGALGITASTPAALVERMSSDLRVLPTAPFMHGAAHWNAWSAWLTGGTVVIQSTTTHLDPEDVWDTVEAAQVTSLQLVGDAFAVPLLRALEARPTRPSSVRFVMSGGVGLSLRNKQRFIELLGPEVVVVDIVGSSESGRQGISTSSAGETSASFAPSRGATVLDEAMAVELDAGSDQIGWLAITGALPLGYLGDAERTARTFPTIAGRRYSIAGDRARRRTDGTIELLGRESVTINTGGEKVFAEEVEDAIKSHPGVHDVMVVGTPSPRWGQEVIAVAVIDPDVSDDEVLAVASGTIARFKLPKRIVRRERLVRSPSGKPDYRWALAEAIDG